MKDKKLLFLLFYKPYAYSFNVCYIFSDRIEDQNNVDDTFLFIFWSFIFVYIKITNKFKKISSFFYGFLFLFFLSPTIYSYLSLSQSDKRTDYPGKEISKKIQYVWDQDFDKQIEFVTGDEWKAGNLSYHLKSRPKWEGINKKM